MHALSRSAVAVVAVGLVLAAAPANALFTGSLPSSKCVGGKINCITKAKSCLLKCHTKALKAGTAADPTCLAKCRDKFENDHSVDSGGCFAKLEAKGGCGPAVGDAGTFAARIDAHVQELVREIDPTGTTPSNACASKKLACVSKYNACVLGAVRKSTKAGGPIGDLSKCIALLDGTDASCIGKLERKYCDPAALNCKNTQPPCLTTNDQGVLRKQDDAFVDDVIEALSV